MKSQYDIIVVGAGPAGSTAARFAAENGASVLLLEKDREVGIPVRCAEGVGEAGLKLVVEPKESWIANIIKGVYLYAPNGKRVELTNNNIGYVLNRKIFDYDLACYAAEAGAEVHTKAYVFDVVKKNNSIQGVRLYLAGKETLVNGKIIIGADGVESRVGRMAGLRTHISMHDIETCAQVTAANVDIESDFCHFYFSHEIAPGGYVWIFPKGNGVANIGLGISGDYSKDKSAKQYLEEFLSKNFPNISILTAVAGGVPCAKTLKTMVANGLILVGDAARQANPVSGGGIVSGMIAAKIAGTVAAKAVREQDISAQNLSDYHRQWQDAEGKTHERFYKIKEAIFKLSNDDLNQIADTLLKIPMEKRTLSKLFTTALINQPKLVVEAAKIFVS